MNNVLLKIKKVEKLETYDLSFLLKEATWIGDDAMMDYKIL